MTEAEWLACEEWVIPLLILRKLGVARKKNGRRKLRLFAIACCRHEMRLLDAKGRLALSIAERFVDGLVGEEQRGEAEKAAFQVEDELWPISNSTEDASEYRETRRRHSAVSGVRWALTRGRVHVTVGNAVANLSGIIGLYGESPDSEANQWLARTVSTLRDIFGNPFRPVTLDPSCLTPSIIGLAGAIYAERAFDRLPILADALEEAGCDHAGALAHCRGDGPHVRGCWVVDLVTGRV